MVRISCFWTEGKIDMYIVLQSADPNPFFRDSWYMTKLEFLIFIIFFITFAFQKNLSRVCISVPTRDFMKKVPQLPVPSGIDK